MSKHYLGVRQKQRIDILGDLNESTTDVWLSLHGYGQLVEYFQRHFRTIVSTSRAFIFPQGAHKFYLQGTEGRVGASWMTKEDRLTDIENQRLYLDELCSWAFNKAPNARFHMVGFSQGVATGMRFLGHSEVPFQSLLAWAGSWPPDLDEHSQNAIRALHMSAWFGTEDPFVDESKKLERTNYYKENYDIVPEVGTYEGKHTFDSNILASEIARLEQLTLKR
jgi:predicted esterase